VKVVTTRGVGDAELGVVDTREVEGAGGLHLAHGEAERPRVRGNVVDGTVGKVGRVHFSNDVVMVHVRHVLEERHTVNIKGRSIESILGLVLTLVGITRHEVNRLHGVVKVSEVELGVGIGRQLVLSLGDEEFMFVISEELTFLGIKVDIVAVHLGGATWVEAITALDTNLDIMVLERHEG